MPASLASGTYPRRTPTFSAPAAPALGGAAASFGRRLWRVLVELGARRAAPHLRQLALHHEHTNPELARRLREAAARPQDF